MFRKSVRKALLIICIVVSLLSYALSPLEHSFPKVRDVSAATDPVVGFFSPERVWTAAGNSNLNLRQPDPRSGDLLIATIAIRPSASTINTPSGWTSLGSWTGTDGGGEGADTGSVRLYWFYKVADGSEGVSNVTFTESGTTSVWTGSIMQVRSATGTYDITAGGYSINGDTTNWGGTLDTDIGLTSGDLVITSAAQNGNPANASGWNISASGITSKSTIIEHGEFSSNTGNDIEIGLSSAIIWAGTNTATPTVSITQSSAASGAVAAIRIRQGSGTNRDDTWVRSAGSQVTGTSSLAVPYPEHSVGELLVLLVGNKYDTATPTTPSGWNLISNNFTGGSGSNTADSGTTRISAYYKEVTSLLSGTQSITISSGNSSIGQIVSVHKDDVDTWTIDSDGGSDDTPDTSWSVTGSGIDLDSASGGDILLVASSINTDARLYSAHGLSASGITFGNVTQTAEYRSTSGTDMTLEVATGRVSGGSGTVSPTFSSTANGSTSTAPAGASMFIKIIGTTASVVSVAITTDGTISYGTLGSGETISTIDLADSQTAQNDGNVAEDFNIKTSAPAGWSLGLSSATDTFVHEYSINNGGNWTKLTSDDSYQTLVTNVAIGSSQNFDLRFTAPSPSTSATEKNITITIQAVAH